MGDTRYDSPNTHDEDVVVLHRDIGIKYPRKAEQAPSIAGSAFREDDEWATRGSSNLFKGLDLIGRHRR